MNLREKRKKRATERPAPRQEDRSREICQYCAIPGANRHPLYCSVHNEFKKRKQEACVEFVRR
jgi:hypothetical protein